MKNPDRKRVLPVDVSQVILFQDFIEAVEAGKVQKALKLEEALLLMYSEVDNRKALKEKLLEYKKTNSC